MVKFNFDDINLLGLLWTDFTGDKARDNSVLKKAYNKAVKLVHPDANPQIGDSLFKRVCECYNSIGYVIANGSIRNDHKLDVTQKINIGIVEMINGCHKTVNGVEINIEPSDYEPSGIHKVFKGLGKKRLTNDCTLLIGNLNVDIEFAKPVITVRVPWYSLLTGDIITIESVNSVVLKKPITVEIPMFTKSSNTLKSDFKLNNNSYVDIKLDVVMPRSRDEVTVFCEMYLEEKKGG